MKLVLVEDSPLVRDQLLRLLAREPAIQVIACSTGEDVAVEIILKVRADAVLLNLPLASGSGIAVLRRARAGGSRARVLILSGYATADICSAYHALGVEGIYHKDGETRLCLDHLFGWAKS